MMKYLRYALIAAGLLIPSLAQAASCFAVGTGSNPTWSTANTSMWASSTGGTAGTCAATGGVPKQAADTATFDANSGGGTVTVDPTTMSGVTLTSITMGAFTGTLDFSSGAAINMAMGSFSISGSGTRTLKLGSGTFTLTLNNGVPWDATTITGLTFNAGTSTIQTAGTVTLGGTRNLSLNSLTYNVFTVGPSSNGVISNLNVGSPTIATFNISAPNRVSLLVGSTFTVTNLNISSSISSPVSLTSSAGNVATVALTNAAVFSGAALGLIAFTGASVTANSSFDLKGNSGVTINTPTGGGSSAPLGGF